MVLGYTMIVTLETYAIFFAEQNSTFGIQKQQCMILPSIYKFFTYDISTVSENENWLDNILQTLSQFRCNSGIISANTPFGMINLIGQEECQWKIVLNYDGRFNEYCKQKNFTPELVFEFNYNNLTFRWAFLSFCVIYNILKNASETTDFGDQTLLWICSARVQNQWWNDCSIRCWFILQWPIHLLANSICLDKSKKSHIIMEHCLTKLSKFNQWCIIEEASITCTIKIYHRNKSKWKKFSLFLQTSSCMF